MLRRYGKYEAVEEIGRGGFGRVYRAYDPGVGRAVAIKVLSGEGDPSLIPRFRAEAMAGGNLHHKNIVTIHEFGEDNGELFLVMEYLDGTDLQEIINRKTRLTLLEKTEIMTQVAQGLKCETATHVGEAGGDPDARAGGQTRSSAEVLQNDTEAFGIDRTFQADASPPEFEVDRAGVKPCGSMFVGRVPA